MREYHGMGAPESNVNYIVIHVHHVCITSIYLVALHSIFTYIYRLYIYIYYVILIM